MSFNNNDCKNAAYDHNFSGQELFKRKIVK